MPVTQPDDRSRLDAYAKTIYQCLHLVRANDKYIWPISHRERAKHYFGPEDAIKKEKITVPAVIDVLAYLAVRHGHGRVALTFATSPTSLTMYIAQNEPADPNIPHYILGIWSLLSLLKDALDCRNSEREEEARTKLQVLLYQACSHRIMDALRAQRVSYEYFVDTMQMVEVDEADKFEEVVQLINGLYDLLGAGHSGITFSDTEYDKVAETCNSLIRTFSQQYPYGKWFEAYHEVADMRTLFSLSSYVSSIIQLPRNIHYLSLLSSHDSSLRDILSRPPEIVVIPIHDPYGATIDTTPDTLFTLLHNAVDDPVPELTLEQFHSRLTANLSYLEGKTEIITTGSTHLKSLIYHGCCLLP
ncbi:hypothetical protein K474DRAFT_1711012 [Panus rudis PR-1116 ss-1]|nr:hypothetical protein K474DRAFT_1711012 [Panus rudis PR-1116 ss-1]